MDTMEGVSLQAVTLSDGSTAYIQHNAKGKERGRPLHFHRPPADRTITNPLLSVDGKLMEGQVIQLEDGSAAYVQHVPKSGK